MKGRKRAYRKRSHVASSDEEDEFTPSSTQKAVTEAPTSRKKRSAKEATFASSATTRRRREQTASPSSDGNTSGLNENAASVNERPVVIVCGGLKSWTLPDNTDVLKFRNGPVLYAKVGKINMTM